MWFDGKHVSEISPEEIEALVANKTPEDGMLEFKRDAYLATDRGRKEALRDITSFANADGGYIIIGIAETNHCATSFSHVPDAMREAGRLRDLCLQCIQPRLRDLEILPKSIPTQRLDVMVIHIPESGSNPHMMTFNENTFFCRRYQDRKRPMSVEEIREAFTRRGSELLGGDGSGLSTKIDELLAVQRANRLAEILPAASTRDAISVDEVDKIMELRFRQHIGDQPYFRIWCSPTNIQATNMREHDSEVSDLLREPPRTRKDGWVIWAATEVKRTLEGWVAVGLDDRTISLLTNGYLEYFQPCNDTTFQWGKQNSTDKTPELYPFAVCELPVNFALLAKKLYSIEEPDSSLIFGMEYLNIKGFVLRPGVPDSMVYMMPAGWVNMKGYEENEIMIRRAKVKPDFDPAPLAFSLVEEVYSAFGLPRKYMPCFTKERQFDIKVNSVED